MIRHDPRPAGPLGQSPRPTRPRPAAARGRVGRLALAALLLGAGLGQAAENLALHRPYTLDPAPDYPYCTDAGDLTDLTDGVYAKPPEGTAVWVMPAAVGWSYGRERFITIEIDLGERCAIEGIRFSSVAGAADVAFPLSVLAFVSDDGQRYDSAGEVITEAVAQTQYVVHRFAVQGLDASGRYVRLVVVRGGMFCFSDEIEVLGTRGAAAAAARQFSREQADQFARGRVSLARQNQSSLALLRLARERLAASAQGYPAAAGAGRAALDRLQGEILARSAAVTVDFRRGLPYTEADRRIGSVVGRYLTDTGPARGLLAWPAPPFAPLLPFDGPGDRAPAVVEPRLLQGEWGELAFNLANPTPRDLRAAVTVEELRRGEQPVPAACLQLAEVVYVEAFGFRTVADALAPVGETVDFPAGLTRQLWLTIRTRDLAPGDYRGSLAIASGEGTPLRLPFAFQVVPIAMPPLATLTTLNFSYLHWPLAATFPEDAARDLREHYVNAQVIPPQAIPYPKADAAGTFTEPLDFAALDRYLALLPETRLWVLWPGFEWDYGNMAPRDGDTRRTAVFSRWVKDVLAHFAARGYGYDKVAFFWMDEPGQKGMREIVAPSSRLLRQVDPQAKVWMDITGDNTESSVREAAADVDIWVPESSLADWGFWQGKRRWFYTCASNKGQSPSGYYRYQLWQAFSRGCEGHAFWVYTDDRGPNSWDDYSGNPGFGVVYEGAKGVIPSKRWEAYRAGVEDYEVCALLAAALKAAAAAGQGSAAPVQAARAALDDGVKEVLANPGDPAVAERVHAALLGHLVKLGQP